MISGGVTAQAIAEDPANVVRAGVATVCHGLPLKTDAAGPNARGASIGALKGNTYSASVTAAGAPPAMTLA